MKTVSGLMILAALTACNDNTPTSTLASAVSPSAPVATAATVDSPVAVTATPVVAATAATVSATVVSTPNQFIYLIVSGKLCAYPIGSNKELIQPQYGSWCVAAASNHNFNSMVMDPTGKYIYASDSAGGKIYQYSITQNVTYTEYGSNIPLTALSPATFNTNLFSIYMAFGSNGNLYIQNNTTGTVKDDKLSISNGLLTYLSTQTQSTEVASYGMVFSPITSVSSSSETYTIDSQTNRVIHYTNGVIQSSFQTLQTGTLSVIALH